MPATHTRPPLPTARFTGEAAPPIHFSVWFLSITNLEDVRGGAKPILVRVVRGEGIG